MLRSLKGKSDFIKALKNLIQEMKTMTSRCGKRLRGDNAPKLFSTEFQALLKENGIDDGISPTESPKPTEKTEHVQQTLMHMTRCLVNMTKRFGNHTNSWEEALSNANFYWKRIHSPP